jgi:serine/threonine-protein kinase
MEWIDGVELQRVFSAKRAGSSGLAAFVVAEICRALAHAHARPIVHRDVSPHNVMLARSGAVKLVDFGIAKLLDELVEPTTRTASLKGSLAYMAPEQLARKPFGPPADVYAAGVLLYELSTGKRLFTSLYELEALSQARAQTIAPPSTLGADPALDAISARALSVDPSQRYENGEAMLQALAPIVDRLQYGPQQLAGLVADLKEAEQDAAPARHTVSVVEDVAPTVVDPPRTRSSRAWIAAAAIALLAVGGVMAWRKLHAPDPKTPTLELPPMVKTAPPPDPSPPAPDPDLNVNLHLNLNQPSQAKRPVQAKQKGHLVDGKLLDPFHR